MQVNIVIVIIVVAITYALIITNFYKDTLNSIIGLGAFILGIPVYFLIQFIKKREFVFFGKIF